MTTHQPIGAGPLPTLGMVIRDAERLFIQAQTLLTRDYDPASAPSGVTSSGFPIAEAALANAFVYAGRALDELSNLAALPLPPAGSAVAVRHPAREPISDPSPRNAVPAAPGRGVGPGLLGP